MGSTKTTGLTLAIVGCGIMCSSILEGVLAKTIAVEKSGKEPLISTFIGTVQSDASVERLKKRFPERLKIVQGDNLEAMQEADIVMLGCKPYMAEKVLGAHGVAKALKGKLLISVLVGTTPDKLDHCMYRTYLTPANENSRYRPEPKPFTYIRRAIPNLAAEYGESATIVQTTGSVAETSHPSHAPLPGHYQEAFDFIFTSIGNVHPVAPELFDIAGILSGPGAVYLTVALDGMLDGGVQQGLKRNDGKKILAQSLKGLAAILEGGMHPAVLRESASSPRGVTIEGLLTLEEERVRHAYSKATIRSNEKSLNM